MVSDLRLCENSWRRTAMRPRGAMDQERMAEENVAGFTRREKSRAIESRWWKPGDHVTKEDASVAIRRENWRDLQVRANQYLSRGIRFPDISEQI